MRRSRYVRPLEPERCAWCGGILSMRNTPAFVQLEDYTFVGPYHRGCAAACLYKYKAGELDGPPPGKSYGHVEVKPREETLPW